MSNEITGTIEVPFHGESAYETAVRHGYEGTEAEWLESLGALDEEKIKNILENVAERVYGYTWYVDTDNIADKNGNNYGKMADCMTDDFVGAWFYIRTQSSEAGSSSYPSAYTIDGGNGFLSLRDYVVWTGEHLVHIPAFEAKASSVKNTDGNYSPKSGVDGLMSSTDKAYLTDLINSFWGKRYIPVYNSPTEVSADWTSGLLINWCRETGWYLGGFAENCGGHPPVVNNNNTSWILLVLVGAVKTGVFPHALQIAFDLANGLMYMRKGWLDGNSAVSGWATDWTQVGGMSEIEDGSVTEDKLADGAVTEDKLADEAVTRAKLSESLKAWCDISHTHVNQSALNEISEDKITRWDKSLCKVILTDDETSVQLTENICEVVVKTSRETHIIIPENPWKYWRCIINATPQAGGAEDIVIETPSSSNIGWGNNRGTVMLVYTEAEEAGNPSNAGNWAIYKVDNLTREIVE